MRASPLFLAIKRVFDLNDRLKVMDFSESFADLWEECLSRDTFNGQHVIIFGVHPPPGFFQDWPGRSSADRIDFRTHFSAYSWAAAYRLLFPQSTASITLVDTSSELFLSQVGIDLRGLYTSEDATGLVSGVSWLDSSVATSLLSGFGLKPASPLLKREQAILRALIQDHLVPDADNHHHLGNILGALLLADSAKAPWQSAVSNLVRALQPFTGLHLTNGSNQTFARRKRLVPVIVFDDLAELWVPFLEKWFPREAIHIARVTHTSLATLIEQLTKLASLPLQERRITASFFGIECIPGDAPFVLLQDLRLFGPGEDDVEREFVGKLAGCAEAVQKATHLKWPTITPTEIQNVLTAWTDVHKDKPDYRKSRSWLPRLLSLTDPLLPIVIFSSTQDVGVLKEFRQHGNIVTGFTKPTFKGVLGEAENWTRATHLAFDNALENALQVSAARQELAATYSSTGRGKTCSPNAGNPSRVEIFIDESGRPDEVRFAVGAVVLISGRQPFDHSAFRSDALRTSDGFGLWGLDDVIRFKNTSQFPGPDQRLPKRHPTGVSDDGTDNNNLLNLILSKLQRSVGSQGADLFVCSLLSEDTPNYKDIASNRHPFHRYRGLLSRLLEILLMHCDPVVSAIEAGAEICIDSATARHPSETWTPSSLSGDFGADIWTEEIDGKVQKLCQTLGSDDVLSQVAGILARGSREALAHRVKRARAVTLLDFDFCDKHPHVLERNRRGEPKPLHYLADWVAHFTWDKKDFREVENIPVLKSWLSKGFFENDGDELRHLLYCHRRWAQGARVTAINTFANFPGPTANLHTGTLNHQLRAKAANWIAGIRTDEIRSLIASIKSV